MTQSGRRRDHTVKTISHASIFEGPVQVVNLDSRINAMTTRYFMTAQQAAAALDVTRATLYAYASRGQLRSEAVPGHARERRYHRQDIERLREKKAARKDPAVAAARGLHWGGPVLESGITLIHGGSLYYRGHDATRLSDTAALEDVAALLWNLTGVERDKAFTQSCPLSARQLTTVRRCAKETFTRMQLALPVAGEADVASYDRRPVALRQTGARILRLLTAVVTGTTSRVPVHRALEAAWTPGRRSAGDAIRAALVLCADHELNVSAFAARCAASAGAAPYDVVSAALATLKGYKHGGVGEEVLALLTECGTPRLARAAVARRLRRGERVPGFGHPLYPDGDPRAGALLRRAAETGGSTAAWRQVQNLWRAGTNLTGDHPNLDFGLAALTRTCALPVQAPLILFALGRSVGWIAHAQEEYASDQIIRPRARYVGPPPDRPEIP